MKVGNNKEYNVTKIEKSDNRSGMSISKQAARLLLGVFIGLPILYGFGSITGYLHNNKNGQEEEFTPEDVLRIMQEPIVNIDDLMDTKDRGVDDLMDIKDKGVQLLDTKEMPIYLTVDESLVRKI